MADEDEFQPLEGEEAPGLGPDEYSRAEFMERANLLLEINQRKWAMPERTAEQEEIGDIVRLDSRMNEAIAAVPAGNCERIQWYMDRVEAGEMPPHRASERILEQTKDIERIHEDIVAWRDECVRKLVKTERQLRAGEISEFKAECLADKALRDRRKKVTRLGLLSVGMDWSDVGDMTDDFYNAIPDGYCPEYREKRKEMRKRFSELTPEQKRESEEQVRQKAEETGDNSHYRLLRDHVAGYRKSEY